MELLHGWVRVVAFFGPVYSDSYATGMIIGTGNVGNYLANNDPSQINTYFTRDGGLSWVELMKGSTIYEYGDFGGLLVLASNVAPTSTIYYSLNGGITFGTVQLPEVVNIINIVIASTRNERFIVIARLPSNTNIRRFWGIDFSYIHERNCTDGDYELWQPHDGVRGPNCVLGHDVTYRRRNRTSECYTEDGLNHVVSKENCVCDESRDYECDFGFELTTITGRCAYQGTNIDTESHDLQCVDGTKTYTISSGYRKLPGDTCTGDINKFNSALRNCSNDPAPLSDNIVFTTISKNMTPIIVGSVLFVLIAGIGGFCLGLRNESFRAKFAFIKAPAWVNIGYSNELVETEIDEDFVGNKHDSEGEGEQDKKDEENVDLEE